MISFLYVNKLLPIADFLKQREDVWSGMLTSIDAQLLKKDWYFRKILKNVSRKVLLQKIDLGPPIVHCLYRDKRYGWSYRVMYPFTGSKEPLAYYPANGILVKPTAIVFQPVFNQLTVSFYLPERSDCIALKHASEQMATTCAIIEKINPEILDWSASIHAIISRQLRELLEFADQKNI